ncbi:hypothetical protein FA13DRAFT_1739030 [Coprinellus micaceus]|uniref:F-box domain-containing protein n=1 Tax=Coprinellus micaceus TaxID=71717 RepID=A0A4Y7SS33_COPMI|nr:hypothetical protein FA13DRAFT_1739030 [Coprinellus micaceus]
MSHPMPNGETKGTGSPLGVFERVPDDVLSLIFETAHESGYYCAPSNELGGKLQAGPALESEATISHVCTLWRDLAYSLPKLWATFRFRRAASTDGFVGELERLRLYLARSVDQDLDLVFNFYDMPKAPVLMDMLLLVPPHVHRLWRFVLHSDRTNFVVPFHKELTGVAAPRLEHFEVCTGKYHNIAEEGYDGEPRWDPKILTLGPPNIKFLKLDAPASRRFRPQFNNLVHFALHPGRAILRQQLLWVYFEQVISLPFIETISIFYLVIAPPDPGRHLRTIEAKRLKHFRIGRTHNNLSPLLYLLPAREANLSLQFPSLKSLYFIDVYVPRGLNGSPDLISFWEALFAKTATITHLCLSHSMIGSVNPEYRMSVVSIWGTILSTGEKVGGRVPRDKGQLPWQNVRLLDVNHSEDVAEAFNCSIADLRPLGLWPNLATIRTPSGRYPPTFEPGNVQVEPLLRAAPDWPPDYPFPSSIPTNEFDWRLEIDTT